MKHPNQPVYLDKQGTARFHGNKIIRFLLEAGPFDLDQLGSMPWDKDDYSQFMQLLGYSVSGYGDLSFIPRKRVRQADRKTRKLLDINE